MEEPDDIEVRDFEFDTFNLTHLVRHGLDAETIWDVWLDEPVVVPDRPRHSGTHLLIGMHSGGVLWTIAVVCVDDELGLWRPITGFPTEREDERQAWYGES
jgi:uncharacterized DUF497 family protein